MAHDHDDYQQALVTEEVKRCGHHGTVLTHIDAPNPETGEPWGWRCPHCFPEAFPGYRTERQRLREVTVAVAQMRDDLDRRRAYSGDPSPGATAALEHWVDVLEAAIAAHRPDDFGRDQL